ncbi:MAG: hypothetical protein WCY59_04200 [Anaerovoracaceae bacterium]
MRRYLRSTGAATLNMLVAPAVSFQLEEIRLHLTTAATSGTLTAAVVSAASSAYNAVLYATKMNGVTDLHWQPARPINFVNGDSLLIYWDNAATRTYGCEVIFSGM